MKKVVFVTGTRADYGKLKPLIRGCTQSLQDVETHIYVSGMHLLPKYGETFKQILADGYDNVYLQKDSPDSPFMDENMVKTLREFSRYVREIKPDMIIVHGDRIDALAGATVAMLNNVCLSHVEGGEVTGTVDETMRHAISKMANIHFVANQESKIRLIQLGEEEEDIYIIGSPDIDIMLSDCIPEISEVKKNFGINYAEYGILIYHPVTSELSCLADDIKAVTDVLVKSGKNYIVIYPNNDSGSEIIFNEYMRLAGNGHFIFFESIVFESFLSLLKHCSFIIGNSSVGIREACAYGVPAIDIGTRQKNRYSSVILQNIINVAANIPEIEKAISIIEDCRISSHYFGDGKSRERFVQIMQNPCTWKNNTQKSFKDMEHTRQAISLYHNEVCF